MTDRSGAERLHSVVKYGAGFLLLTAVFALSYCQAPLYFSNQNQYFVHALAQAGFGHLNEDWLAGTKDPTPIFTAAMALTYRYLHPYCYYIYYALIQGLYLANLLGIFAHVAGKENARRYWLVFLTLIVLIHSGVLRLASARLFGVDYPWYFQAGVAGQYVLGPMLQPSVFGVLLIASIWAFVGNRPYLAATLAVFGATIHSTYVLSAAFLTLAYLVVLAGKREFRRAIYTGGLALVLVLPIVVYHAVTFRPTSAEAFARAQHILVHFRIPHHCLPELWLDEIAAAQIAWILAAIWLSRQTILYPIMLIPFALGAAGAVLQVMTDSDTLALLFPWRISVILMPLATTVLLTRCITMIANRRSPKFRPSSQATTQVCIALLIAAVIGGVCISTFGLAFQTRDQELPLMDFVRENTSPGEVYLIPIRVPNLKSTVRGSSKSDFKPLSTLKDNQQFIPLNLQRFRLKTGAPIFVDFKSIPYQDQDVLEWRERIRLVETWYKKIRGGDGKSILDQLDDHKITHLVVRANQSLPASDFERIYADDQYQVYRRKTYGNGQ